MVWGNKVFVTAGDPNGNRGFLLAVSVSDGKALWRKEYALAPYRMNILNSYASATPAVDADNVYALWPATDTVRRYVLLRGACAARPSVTVQATSIDEPLLPPLFRRRQAQSAS